MDIAIIGVCTVTTAHSIQYEFLVFPDKIMEILLYNSSFALCYIKQSVTVEQ